MPDEEKKKFDPIVYFKSWRRKDWLAFALFIIIIIVFTIPVYSPKNGCEVARPAYKCSTAKEVMVEHCVYWGNWSCPHCEKDAWKQCVDPSLPQVEWYIGNLCKIHNQFHPSDSFDCSNLKVACNQAAGQQVCPFA